MKTPSAEEFVNQLESNPMLKSTYDACLDVANSLRYGIEIDEKNRVLFRHACQVYMKANGISSDGDFYSQVLDLLTAKLPPLTEQEKLVIAIEHYRKQAPDGLNNEEIAEYILKQLGIPITDEIREVLHNALKDIE